VIGYLTLDPADLLGADRRLAARVRAGYTGANEGGTLTVLGAGRGEALQWLLGVTQTDAHELVNQGTNDSVSPARTRPNQQDRGQAVRARRRLRSASAVPALDRGTGPRRDGGADGGTFLRFGRWQCE
jgi:hemoglobin/transferrin/lactoferrin receptor protein